MEWPVTHEPTNLQKLLCFCTYCTQMRNYQSEAVSSSYNIMVTWPNFGTARLVSPWVFRFDLRLRQNTKHGSTIPA